MHVHVGYETIFVILQQLPRMRGARQVHRNLPSCGLLKGTHLMQPITDQLQSCSLLRACMLVS